MLSQSRISLFCAAGVLLASAGMAQATTIYSDSLSGSDTAPLTGTTPATDTTAAKWTLNGAVGDGFYADGLTPGSTGGNFTYSINYLPYNTGTNLIAAGNIYTVSAVLSPTSGATGNWLAMGFLDGGSLFNNATKTSGPWMLLTDAGQTQTFGGPGVNNQYAAGTTNGNVTGGTAEVVLNTSSAQWTTQWLYEAPSATSFTSLGTYTYAAGANPTTLGGVGIADYQSAPGQIQNFQFTSVATPEPATFGIFGIGIAGLLLLKKRRTA